MGKVRGGGRRPEQGWRRGKTGGGEDEVREGRSDPRREVGSFLGMGQCGLATAK